MKNLDGILKSFNKTLKQLDSLTSKNSAEVVEKFKAVEQLEMEAAELVQEADAAERVANNIRNLLGETE